MTTVVIDGVEYPYLFGLQAMAIYERITGQGWEGYAGVKSAVAAHFACLLAANVDFPLSFAEFANKIDNKPTFEELGRALEREVERWGSLNQVTSNADVEADKKQKKAKKKG